MELLKGVVYHFKGLRLSWQTRSLFWLGMARFLVLILFTIFAAGILLLYHQEMLNSLWPMPHNQWLIWIWQFLSWLVYILLLMIAALIGFGLSQLLFSMVLMDLMSSITEKMITGEVQAPERLNWFQWGGYLLKQEIPRMILPLILLFFLTVVAWLTPAGPVMTILSSLIAAVFLAWDNSDIVPARRMLSFKARLAFLKRNILFHLGFGLVFLIPFLNMIMLSYAPVGATLYYLEEHG